MEQQGQPNTQLKRQFPLLHRPSSLRLPFPPPTSLKKSLKKKQKKRLPTTLESFSSACFCFWARLSYSSFWLPGLQKNFFIQECMISIEQAAFRFKKSGHCRQRHSCMS